MNYPRENEIYNDIDFDEEYGAFVRLCESCNEKLTLQATSLIPVGGYICSVRGCENIADFYLDIEAVSV